MSNPNPDLENAPGGCAAEGSTRSDAGWLRLLPKFISRGLRERHSLQKIITNSGWLVADRVIRLGVGLVLTVWIARYLGPEQFGLWNFAIAFTAIFSVFSTLGLDAIVVRELVLRPADRNALLGSALGLRLAGGISCLAITALAIGYVRPGESLTMALVLISASGFIFQSTAIVDMYFQAKLQSKFTVFATNLAFFIFAGIKIYLLAISAKLIAFAIAGLAETMLSAVFLVLMYRLATGGAIAWRWSTATARKLLRDSWPLILAGLSVMIYMRVDQIMVGQMLGNSEVGIYSVAMRISEVWYFLPGAITSSVFPGLIACRETNPELYLTRLQRLFSAVVWLGIGVALIMTLAGSVVVEGLFGATYSGATVALQIHVWGGIFVGLGVASGIWFAAENLTKYSFYRTLGGCAVNVILNVFTIPRFGVSGAAFSTVVSQILAAFLFDVSTSRTRALFFIKLRSFNPAGLFSARS